MMETGTFATGLPILSSGFAGLAAYLVMRPLISDLLSPQSVAGEAWDRQQLRHLKLQAQSRIFALCGRWICGLARVLERRVPSLLVPRNVDTTPRQLSDFMLSFFVGAPKSIEQAIRIRSQEQPWVTAELIAAGFVLAVAAGLASVVLFTGSLGAVGLGVVAGVTGLVAYRLWIQNFIARAREKQKAILQLLPHSIDTISMVLQSGGTFLAGVEAVIVDFPRHPLSDELRTLRNRLERGQSMSEALRGSADAISLPEFDEVMRTLTRVHEHGAPSAESFVRLAKQMRLAHLRRMEEQVGQAESKITLPTMLVLFSCMLICAGPFVLSMIESEFLQ